MSVIENTQIEGIEEEEKCAEHMIEEEGGAVANQPGSKEEGKKKKEEEEVEIDVEGEGAASEFEKMIEHTLSGSSRHGR